MRYSFLRVLSGAAFVACILIAPVTAAVYPPQNVLPAQTVQQFLSNPAALLTQYPNGGPQMITAVRDLAASDPQTLNALVGLLSKANTDQSTAIGTALGQVAKMAISTDQGQGYATDIQNAVVASRNDSAQVAFSAVVGGNIKLTASTTGVGGGGGGEELTNPTNTGFGFSNNLVPDLHTFAANTPDSFTNTPFSPGTPGSGSVSQSSP